MLHEAITLNQQMEEIVRTNSKEYEEQNMFMRPVVKRMFQQGTGLKVEEWLAQAQEMTSRLERAAGDAREGKASLNLVSVETYLAHLRRMVDYITRQESDARGWIRDSEQLKAALEASHERKKTVQRLVSILVEMQQPGKGSAL